MESALELQVTPGEHPGKMISYLLCTSFIIELTISYHIESFLKSKVNIRYPCQQRVLCVSKLLPYVLDTDI